MISERLGEIAFGSLPWVTIVYAIGTFYYGSSTFVAIAKAIACKKGRVKSIITAFLGLWLTITFASQLI